jgi:hypothetical protein
MPAAEAAANFIQKIKNAAEPVVNAGRDAVVGIFLDGENAWEYYPRSGREFLRRLYAGIQADPRLQALTVSEAIAAEAGAEVPKQRTELNSPVSPAASAVTFSEPVGTKKTPVPVTRFTERRHFGRLTSLVPGSWINANFNVWIGAPEDNRSWDYLSAARDFYANNAINVSDAQRALAYQEILIAEGSDWNWWYGPEHHTVNDRDFDELYRKHLSNVYHALGATPPDYLAQPVAAAVARPTRVPQTAYIHPRLSSEYERYFDWIGAAMYTADRRAGAMHGKQFLLDAIFAGVDETNLYGRLDFISSLPEGEAELVVNCECTRHDGSSYALRLEATLEGGAITAWCLREPDSPVVVAGCGSHPQRNVQLRLRKRFEFALPLVLLDAQSGATVRLRFSLWRDRLPIDALPVEGWLELRVATEDELAAGIYAAR